MAVEVVVGATKDAVFETFLHEQIKAFNNAHSPLHLAARKPGAQAPLNIMLKGTSGETIGGLAATTYWQWLDIDNFYVPQALRGQGLGTTLLQQAERIAVERGCRRCFLSTFEFQARLFYEKHGYVVVGELVDYPPDSAMYWLRKDLVSV